MLTKMLELAKERAEAPAAAAPASSDSGDYDGPAFNVLTFNAISSVGLERFPKGRYAISGDGSSFGAEPMAIMLRSHKLQESDVDPSVRGIVRCGAGTNNCNVPKVRGAPRARSARCLDAACLRTRGSAPRFRTAGERLLGGGAALSTLARALGRRRGQGERLGVLALG